MIFIIIAVIVIFIIFSIDIYIFFERMTDDMLDINHLSDIV